MKKYISVLLSVILILTLVPALSACSGDDRGNKSDSSEVPAVDSRDGDTAPDFSSELIIGSWKFDIDLSGTVTEMFAQLGIDGVTSDSVILPLIFMFKDDGNASLRVDEVKKDAFMNDYVEKALKGFEDYMLMIFKKGGQEATVEDVYAVLGMTRAEFGKSISDSIDMSSFASDIKYVLRDGKLFIYDEAGGEAFDENDYVTVEIGKDEMKFIDYHPAKEGGLFFDGMVTLPTTLPRIK